MAGEEPRRPVRSPSLADARIAIAVLITLIPASLLLYGDAAIPGPAQVALSLAAPLAAGAAISGAGYGDRLAPLSDTANLGGLTPHVDPAPARDTPAREVRSAPARPSPKSIRDDF